MSTQENAPQEEKKGCFRGCFSCLTSLGLIIVLAAAGVACVPSLRQQALDIVHSIQAIVEGESLQTLTDTTLLEQNKAQFEKMFVWTEEKPLNAGNLESALDQVWPEEWSKPKTLLEFFNKDQEHYAELAKLQEQIKQNEPFIIFGASASNEEWGILQNIRPEAFHACLEACLNWKGETLWNYQKPAFEARFYWNKNDIEDAKTLREWVLKSIFTGTEEDQAEKTKYEEAPLKQVLTLALSEDYQSTLQRNVKQKVGEENKVKFMELLRNLTRQDVPKSQPAKAVNPGQSVPVNGLRDNQGHPVGQPRTAY